MEAPYETDEELDTVLERIFALSDKIAATPARTLGGVRAQIAMALDCHQGGSVLGETEELALENALAALDRLAT